MIGPLSDRGDTEGHWVRPRSIVSSLMVASAMALTPLATVVAKPMVAGPASDDVAWIDASVIVDGQVLAAESEDIDGDGRQEITVAVYDRSLSRRELRVWRLTDDGQREQAPFFTVPVLDDVVAWCWADVRDEAGKELVFLSRSGAWSYSTTLDGYRNNIRRLVDVELLYDIPSPESLPHWDYVLSCPEGDQLLLPELGGYSIWVPDQGDDANTDGALVRGSQFRVSPRLVQTTPGDRRRIEISAGGVVVSSGRLGNALVDVEGRGHQGPLVDAGSRLRSPALVDVNGDGRDDLVRLGHEELHIHLATAQGISNAVTITEDFPLYLRGLDDDGDDTDTDLEFFDMDDDGDVDLLVKLSTDGGSRLESNQQVSFLVLINDGRLLPDQPQQILKFEAATVSPTLTDVDGDGRADLVFDKVTAPSLTEIASPDGLSLTRSVLVFLGNEDGLFERRPALDRPQSFDETSLGDVVTNQIIGADCNGDGIGDLIDVNLAGEVRIHRILKESSFFGGDTWTVDETAWRRFGTQANMEDFSTGDLNGDGLADVLSTQRNRLTLLLSKRVGADQ